MWNARTDFCRGRDISQESQSHHKSIFDILYFCYTRPISDIYSYMWPKSSNEIKEKWFYLGLFLLITLGFLKLWPSLVFNTKFLAIFNTSVF